MMENTMGLDSQVPYNPLPGQAFVHSDGVKSGWQGQCAISRIRTLEGLACRFI
jgi:hypothetical protein